MPVSFATLQDIVIEARQQLSQGDWDYLIGGADTETSLKRNRLAFDRLALKARVLLHDVAQVSMRRQLLGVDLRIPVILAPLGSMQAFEAGGGLSAARAAETFGTLSILSSVCSPDFETVARECAGPKIYQLYAHGSVEWMMDIVDRTPRAGYRALCLTVDTQVYTRRERDILKRYVPIAARRPENAPPPKAFTSLQPSFSWDLIKRIKDRLTIPLMLKGIACAEDAALAVEHGIDVVYVSNHGGRQLDQGRATLDTLPEIVAAVAKRAPVIVDGGILRGTDVLKALALGADAVGVGRLEGLAMAAGGAAGVVRMLELLETEMRINLASMGLSSIEQLTPTSVFPAEPVVAPHVLSGFPLLGDQLSR
jgi:isopentenyl diphosphate isomerase/L-lactate dehydrogenase-like FMN-dependent dehydrogenase